MGGGIGGASDPFVLFFCSSFAFPYAATLKAVAEAYCAAYLNPLERSHLFNWQNDALLLRDGVPMRSCSGCVCDGSWVYDPLHSRRPCFLKRPWTCYLSRLTQLNMGLISLFSRSFSLVFGLPELLVYWNNCHSLSTTRLTVQLLNRDIKFGCLPLTGVKMGHHLSLCHSVRWGMVTQKPSMVTQRTSMVHYLQWLHWPGAQFVVWDLWVQPIQYDKHQKRQCQGAFIHPWEFNHFSVSSFSLSTLLFRILMRKER